MVIATALFAGFVHYFYKVKLTSSLLLQAFIFALVTHFAMRMYRGFEHMSTFGETCPRGHAMVPDPLNKDQLTCVPTGHDTLQK